MKNKIIFFITFILLVGMVTSCEKDGVIITLPNDVVLPTIVSVPDDMILLEENEADTLIFTGTPVDPGFSASVNYFLELCAEGNGFIDVIELYSGIQDTMMKISVKDFNEMLIAIFPADEALSVDFRIRCNLVADAGTGAEAIEYYSNIVNDETTPYETIIDYGEVFLLGDATIPGWDNMAALPTIHLGNGVFQIETTLTANLYIKFIAVLGQWAPQWGTDATGTWESGPLVYRPTEDEPDPDAIPSPPTDGDYVITADIVNLTYTVEAAK